MAKKEGIDAGLVKIKVLRPFPDKEIKSALKDAEAILVPEYNIVGWLAREIASRIDASKVFGGPRVFGGMTMPPEIIVGEMKKLARVVYR